MTVKLGLQYFKEVHNLINEILMERFIVLHIELINTLLSIRLDNYKKKEFRKFDNIKSKIFIVSRYLEISDEYIGLLERLEAAFYLKTDDDTYLTLVDKLSNEFYEIIKTKGEIESMNTFSKERIFACCKIISEYLQTIEFNIQDEELFSKLLDGLKLESIGIPVEVYSKIEAFVEDSIGKNVLEGFGNIDFSEDEAEKLEDGSIHLKNDCAISKLFINYIQGIEKIKDDFEAFMEKELRPYLSEGVV